MLKHNITAAAQDIRHCDQVSFVHALFESIGMSALSTNGEGKKKKKCCLRIQMQRRSSKRSVCRKGCSFLLWLDCSAKDSLLKKAQREWLCLDFILVGGHASFYSERGAERHSGEKPA